MGLELVEDDDVDGLAAGIGVENMGMSFLKDMSTSWPKYDSSESILGKKFISGVSSAKVTEYFELDWRGSITRIEFFFSTGTIELFSK